MSVIVLNPMQEAVVRTNGDQLAPRLSTLTGKTLGLWSNKKLNATKLLELVAEDLARDYTFKIVRGGYDASIIMPADGWGPIEQCDAVLLANGDCGSCSSSGIANAIELEKRGIPTMLISTPPFTGVCQTMIKLRGMPQIRWAVVEHPIGSLDQTALADRAVKAAAQFREIILQSAADASAA